MQTYLRPFIVKLTETRFVSQSHPGRPVVNDGDCVNPNCRSLGERRRQHARNLCAACYQREARLLRKQEETAARRFAASRRDRTGEGSGTLPEPFTCRVSALRPGIQCKAVRTRGKQGRAHWHNLNGAFLPYWLCDAHRWIHVARNDEHLQANREILAGVYSGTNDSGCWLAHDLTKDGYGRAVIYADIIAKPATGRATWYTHRFAVAALGPEDQQGTARRNILHHRCNVKACFNPVHLVHVTKSDNERLSRNPAPKLYPNLDALQWPALHEFAAEHGLPLTIP